MPVVDLTVDRSLLCPNFDGYKLSFEPVPVLRQDFPRDPLKLEPHLNQFSLLHVELFAMHNLLTPDPWARSNCYFINIGHEVVLCSYDSQNGRPRGQRVVYSVTLGDHGDGGQHLVGDYNYTMRFVSEKFCVLCDGMSTLYLLDTGDRLRSTPWTLISRTPINCEADARGYILYDARLDIVQQRKQISTVCGHVGRRESANPAATHSYMMQLVWARWTQPELTADFAYAVCEQLETTGSIYYCAFEPRAESLVLCSNREVQTPAQRLAAEAAAAEAAARVLPNGAAAPAAYSWTQTEEELVLRFPLPAGAGRQDLSISISCTSDHVVVKHLTETLLDGTLYARFDNELTTWTQEADALLMTLQKESAAQWPQLLASEQPEALPENGQEEQAAEPQPERLPIPNLEEPIEDCDFPLGALGADIKMVRFNLPTGAITHTIFLGSTPPLFATSLRAGFPAAFATRQGVDAAVWLQAYQPAKPDEWSVRHEGNFHAFGYVQASKEQRKFIDCCPEQDYAVICESYRHVFIYKPRYDTAGGLRKRNGPPVVIGKQSLVTLDEGVGEVLGLSTAANVITVMTEHAVLYLQV